VYIKDSPGDLHIQL